MPRSDVYKRGQADRPKLDPYSTVSKQDETQVESGEEKDQQEAPTTQTDPFLGDFKIIPLDRIRPGEFQSRLVKDPIKDENLRKRIKKDLDRYGRLRHVFRVVIDPDDPTFYNPAFGGHRRLDLARELGVTEVSIWMEEYDPFELARGTYDENDPATRQDLNIVEQGLFFQRVQKKLGWSQTEIAERFDVEGGQPHVSRCMTAVSYPEDLQQMLFTDPDRGMRAAKELHRLEVLGAERAKALRAPLIAAFQAANPKDRLSTDQLALAVDKILSGGSFATDKTTEETNTPVPTIPSLKRWERAKSVRKKWESFRKEFGNEPLDDDVRAEVEAVYKDIGKLLGHS